MLQHRLIPFAKDHMRQTEVRETDEYGCLFQQALTSLQVSGMTNDNQDASAALIMRNERHPRTAGGHPALHANWGVDTHARTTPNKSWR